MKTITLLFVFLTLLCQNLEAQRSTIYSNSFENCEDEYTEFGSFSDGSSDYFIRTNSGSASDDDRVKCASSIATSGEIVFTNTNGFYYTGEDVDRSAENPNTSNPGDFGSQQYSSGVHFANINVASFSDIEIELNVASAFDTGGGKTFETGDYLKIFVDPVNDGNWQLIGAFEADLGIVYRPLKQDTNFDGNGDGAVITPNFTTFTFDVPDNATNMNIRIEVNSTAGNQEIAFDELSITGIDSSLRLDSSSTGNITASPNPFSNYVSIDSDDNLTANVYNVLGQLISIQSIDSQNQHIDLSNRPSGIYITKLINEEKNIQTTLKLIKK